MILGVIADDFTGGTDIASFLVKEGMSTIQLIGVPEASDPTPDADAVVISLKSRSCPKEEAIKDSVAAARYLKSQGCKNFFFKYCSTFDSTEEGNIGPVTEALMKELNTDFTIFSTFCEKGQDGIVIAPPTYGMYEIAAQTNDAKVAYAVRHDDFTLDAKAILDAAAKLKSEGYNGAVVDAIDDADLYTQGQAFKDTVLVTGGSGLGMGLAKALLTSSQDVKEAQNKGRPNYEKTIVLSGSCSAMTNAQVAKYKESAPSFVVDIEKCVISDEKTDEYASEVCKWAVENSKEKAPLIYATANPEALAKIQKEFGAKASSQAIENFFYKLSAKLKEEGFKKYIIAGGETSGQVTKALKVKGFYIGPTISPGVPWVKAVNENISLALKSGNFGEIDFFNQAQGKF